MRFLARLAYRDGYRAGLKAAIEVAKDRGDAALYLAPEGKLTLGVHRAQVAHVIELELRRLLAGAK